MKYFICSILFASLFYLSDEISGQTLIGIKGGVSWTYLRAYGHGVSTSYPSYSFALDLKGRKPKAFHMGASVMFYQSSYNWMTNYGGHFGGEKDVHYTLESIRFTLFPELSFGKRFQFFFNAGPYLSTMITSSKSGYSYDYNPITGSDYQTESGSANDDIHKADFGLMEGIGASFLLLPWLTFTLEDNGSIGILNINRHEEGGVVKNSGICILGGVAFIIPKKKSNKEKN